MVGDWGSGLPHARKVSDQMRSYTLQGLADGRDTNVVHLGDVYYAGFPSEYVDRFLQWWPVRPAEAGDIRSWSMNGNHDMYSGGDGYFDTLLADPRFAGTRARVGSGSTTRTGDSSAWTPRGTKSTSTQRA